MKIMMNNFERTLYEFNKKLKNNNHNNIVNMDLNMTDKNTVTVGDNNNGISMQNFNNNDAIDELLAADFGVELLTKNTLVHVNSEEELENKSQNVKQLTITLEPANETITSKSASAGASAKTISELELSKKSARIENVHLQQPTPLICELVDGNKNFGDDDDDAVSSDSNLSNLSEMSDMSGREWKPVCTRPIRWVQKQIQTGANPRVLLSQMLPASNHQFAAHMNDMVLWRILASILSEPPRRQKLRNINSFDDVVSLIKFSKNIIVLTGAGVSVSCGIPDFRSSDGIYARLAKDYPDLPDPQAMFDINYFARDPRPFYKFAREIYPGQFRPSPCHRFIRRLEEKQKLLRNYTQNIDTLEQVAGIRNVIECHGSFSTASCTKCKFKCSADDIRDDIFAQRIPLCPHCQPNALYSQHVNEPVPSVIYLRRMVEHGIMKPDIVFFGEGLPEEFHTVMASDKTKCDLLIVIGSSLKVRPVALIPSSLPAHVPQILINREQLHHLEFDVQLLGDSDVIINQLCHRLAEDFTDICYDEKILIESKILQSCEGLLTLSRNSSTSEISHNSEISANTDETATTEDDYDDDDNVEDINNIALSELEQDEVEINNQLEEEEGTIPEECGQQLDTDSQSVKSNASTDIALRSDSGFESSTSSGTITNLHSAEQQVTVTTKSTIVINDYDDISLVNSIEEEKQGTLLDKVKINEITKKTKSIIINKTEQKLPESRVVVNNIKSSMQQCHKTIVTKHLKQKRRNTAECLLDGTYFCNEKKSAYIFPGAQVSWYNSSSSEDDDVDGEITENDNRNKYKNSLDNLRTKFHTGLPLPSSPPPATNEKNNKTSTTSDITTQNKQISLETLPTALAKATKTNPNTHPLKAEKRRSDSDENDHDIEERILQEDYVDTRSSPPVKKKRESNSDIYYNNKFKNRKEEECTTNISLTNCNSSIDYDNT